jgi:hypothetical protein
VAQVFQYKLVDFSNIDSIVKTEMTQIKILFIDERTDLNICTFNEDFGFYIYFLILYLRVDI